MSIAISSRLAGTLSYTRVAETVVISAINITNPRQYARHLIQSKLEKSILSDLTQTLTALVLIISSMGERGEQLDCMK
jgi:hypothetical protein